MTANAPCVKLAYRSQVSPLISNAVVHRQKKKLREAEIRKRTGSEYSPALGLARTRSGFPEIYG